MLTRRARQLPLLWAVLASPTFVAACSKHDGPEISPATSAVPSISILETSYDFGRVVEGEKLTHAFVIKNVGQAPLHVTRMHASCSCIVTSLKDKELPPGGEGRIEVTFDTNHFSGNVRKSLSVFSDAPNNPRAVLEVRAQIEELLVFEPDYVKLRSKPGEKQTGEAWLTGKLKGQARLKLVENRTEPELTVAVVEKPADDGTAVQGLRFTVFSKQGEFGSGNLRLATGLTNPTFLNIGYSWTVEGNIRVSPHHLFFSNAEGASPERILRVSSRTAGFKLLRARILSGPFTANLKARDTGNEYEIRVLLNQRLVPTPTTVIDAGKLELLTNDPLEPKREVLIRVSPGVPRSRFFADPQGERSGLPSRP